MFFVCLFVFLLWEKPKLSLWEIKSEQSLIRGLVLSCRLLAVNTFNSDDDNDDDDDDDDDDGDDDDDDDDDNDNNKK